MQETYVPLRAGYRSRRGQGIGPLYSDCVMVIMDKVKSVPFGSPKPY